MNYILRKTKNKIKKDLSKLPIIRNILWGNSLYKLYKRNHSISRINFLIQNRKKFWVQPVSRNKALQIAAFLDRVDIVPVENRSFFYSLDCFKTVRMKYRIFDNYTVDYNVVVNESLKKIKMVLKNSKTEFAKKEVCVIDAFKSYLDRCRKDEMVSSRYTKQLDAVETLFERPSESFFEALQRILFFNQFLWQTGHKLNGFGHLDWMLIDLYREDIRTGRITERDADELIKDFFCVLHECYWFKSSSLLGDTGQIIILGGLGKDGEYHYNELTYKFIQISETLKLPDPKVLLRCSHTMPEDLLERALECIATGIGAPLLSNDDMVIPALISWGYDEDSAYRYATSACWEPLIIGNSGDQNNIASLNFAQPFVEMLNHADLDSFVCLDDMLGCYKRYLSAYLERLLSKLSKVKFEEDPIVSMLSESAIRKGIDIVRGGAIYNNLGLTSVGMGCVVNSLLNVDRLVYGARKYTLVELNELRKQNYASREDVVKELKNLTPFYGCDEYSVVNLTKQIEYMASEEIAKYSTRLGGIFKFGLSSPNYILDASSIEATFDGRKKGEPFGVHISSNKPVAPTELISFAMKLDYNNCRLNGNVVDLITAPSFLRDNLRKYALMLRAAFKGGLYQLQMNVVDSATLIEAKKNPALFPNLIVRVWGFSAYFKDLPEEYKDVLIARALESEKAA